jgi:hypothetical protein
VHDHEVYLAAFCATLPQIRQAMHKLGKTAALDAAIHAVREGTPVLHVLPSLGIEPYVLTGTGTTSRNGYWGPRAGGGVTRGMRPSASGEAYRCPDGSCGLEIIREPGGPMPDGRCWLRDQPLAVGEA